MAGPFPSWPGLSRPSTSSPPHRKTGHANRPLSPGPVCRTPVSGIDNSQCERAVLQEGHMSTLRGDGGPRYRVADGGTDPYETITRRQADADHRRGDRRRRSVAAAGEPVSWTKSTARWRRTWSSSSATSTSRERAAPRLRPPLRRAAHPSRRAARAGPSGADDHPRRQGQPARQRRRLAQRRVLRRRAADGQHPLYQHVPAAAAATRCSPACTRPTRRCRTG